MNMSQRILSTLGVIVAVGAASFGSALADDYTWFATGNANWGTPGNWRVGGVAPAVVPSDLDNIVAFNDAGTGALQIQGSRTINNLTFDNTVRDVSIINASSSTDYTLKINGTLSVNSPRVLNFRGTSSNLMTMEVTNFSLTAGTVNFGVSATQYLKNFSSSGTSTISGGTVNFNIGSTGSASFNDLTVNGGEINIVGATTGTSSLSVTRLSGSAGVIQTQAASGTAVGQLVVGGNTTNATYGGVLANGGSGNTLSLNKTGTNTQVLTGANTFTGGTTISNGILQLGDGGSSGSLAGAIVNDAQLHFNRGDSAVHANAISGSGSVSQIGAGVTILTGANTYAGLTTISAGTLQIGNGGSLGSITGNISIQNDSSLVVARTGTFTYGGSISGTSGTILKQNSGTWVLTAASTFSGTTEIAPGTPNNNITLAHANALQNSTVNVRVGDGLRFATASDTYTVGTLQGSGSFALNDSDGEGVLLRVGNNNTSLGTSYTGSLGGLGSLEKIGTGSQRFTGASTYSGGTVVSAGTLLVNNTTGSGVGTGAVQVRNSAVLGGLGHIALGASNSVTVEAGGGISAGTTGIGMLTFDFGSTTGGLQALDSSFFAFDLGASNASDLVRLWNYTAGDFTLGSTVYLNLSNVQNGTFNLFSFYSDAGTTLYGGAFDVSNFEVVGLDGFGHTLSYDNGIVSLSVVPEPSTMALLGLAVLVGAFRRRRERKN